MSDNTYNCTYEIMEGLETAYLENGMITQFLDCLEYLYEISKDDVFARKIKEVCYSNFVCPNCYSDLNSIETEDYPVEYMGREVREKFYQIECDNCDYINQ